MSPPPEPFVVKQLKRVHDEANHALENEDFRSSAAIADRFNEILETTQNHRSSEDRIQEIEPARSISAGINNMDGIGPATNEIRDIKLKTLKIADALEVNTTDFEQAGESTEMIAIEVNQNQSVDQQITISNLKMSVDDKMMSESEKKELKTLIQEVDEELNKEEPDTSKIRNWINEARVKSPDAAKKLQMIALERGFDLLAGV